MLVYITCSDATEAKRIARHLVETQLVAGVNILPGHSIYRWQNEICEHAEAIMLAQAPEANFEAILTAVKSLHSYQNPCIIALPISHGNPDFLQWIAQLGVS